MQRIEFQDAPDSMTRDDIIWKNLNIAVACNNMGIVFNAMTAWLKYNKNLGYKGLEKQFRKEKIDAYILAKPTTVKDRQDMRFVDQYTLRELNYQLIVIMKSDKEALKEILTHHDTYEDNFNNIPNAGIAVEKNTYFELKRAGLNMFTFNSDIMLSSLCAGTKIMIPIRVNLENEFNNVFRKYQDSEYFLSTKIYGHAKDGQEVYSMTGSKDGVTKLLSSIGMMIGNTITGDEKDIKFILLQDQSTWTWEEDKPREEEQKESEPEDEASKEVEVKPTKKAGKKKTTKKKTLTKEESDEDEVKPEKKAGKKKTTKKKDTTKEKSDEDVEVKPTKKAGKKKATKKKSLTKEESDESEEEVVVETKPKPKPKATPKKKSKKSVRKA